MRVAIIGAGLAGLTCAATLSTAGHAVAVFDKGRGAAGRIATRRVPTAQGEASFDHGAGYFTVRDPGFRAQVEHWQRDGLAAPWPAAGPDAWVGLPAMNAPTKALARPLDVRWSTRVEALERDGGRWRLLGEGLDEAGFDAALVAVPAEQAAPLLAPWDARLTARAEATPSLPCWTVLAAFATRVALDADVLPERGIVDWAARNSAKPGRAGPESWVIHARSDWSAQHLEDAPADIVPHLLRALAEQVGGPLPEPLVTSAHRWRYARSDRAGEGALWNQASGLGACGDWLLGPRVECAWLSGQQLAATVAS